MASVSRALRVGQVGLQSSRLASTSTSSFSTNSNLSDDSFSTTKSSSPGPKQKAREEAYDAMIEKIDARRARRTTCEHFIELTFLRLALYELYSSLIYCV